MLPDEDKDDERAEREQDGSRNGEAKDESRRALSPRRIRARAPQTLPEGRSATSGGGGRQRRSLAALRGALLALARRDIVRVVLLALPGRDVVRVVLLALPGRDVVRIVLLPLAGWDVVRVVLLPLARRRVVGIVAGRCVRVVAVVGRVSSGRRVLGRTRALVRRCVRSGLVRRRLIRRGGSGRWLRLRASPRRAVLALGIVWRGLARLARRSGRIDAACRRRCVATR